MKKLLFILLFLSSLNTFGCRYTIRDIGYTRLNIETYIVRFEADTTQNRLLANYFRNVAAHYSINSNINYTIIHKPNQQPVLTCVNSQGKTISKKKEVTKHSLNAFYNELLFSPLQQTMYNQIGNVFAYVIGFYNKDDKKTDNVIDNAFLQFQKISPNLDKKIDENIMKIVIEKEGRKEEALFLKAVGINPESSEPAVVILFGRGRLTGKPLSGDKITTHNLLNQLVTLGTDCECGIDLSPLLQQAIPFNWSDKMNQEVTNMLKIDVENPMILAEMSRILSKEPLETGKSKFSFVPQTIDLDAELAKGKKQTNDVVIEESSFALKTTLIAVGILFLFVLGIGFLFFKRK